jgi:tetratricopeptide (TPR) repeat protein/TolB-like protein
MTDPLARLSAVLTGRYRIERELGAGGMAIVYLAEDTKHHRQVAVKVLRAELAANIGAERFVREIEIAARLQHPHILPLHDSGGSDDVLFYVMPFVEGQSLRDRIVKAGALPIDEATRIIREVTDALAYSHQHGVVHRDIKPENILLSGAHALVTDFGVAKAVSDAAASAHLTATGMAMGTPAYMAPEQATADPTLDHRVDIYAVGVMAYEILAGRAPFLGNNPQQIIAGHLTQRPDPISVHRPAVSPALEAVVMRCLEKNPADRWQTADEMLRALDSVPAQSGATAAVTSAGSMRTSGGRAGTTSPPASAPARNPWRRALGGAAATLVLAAAGVFWFGRVGRAGTLIGNDVLSENDVVLVSDFQNHTADSSLAATVTDAIRVDLQQSRAVRVMSQSAMWAGLTRMGLGHGSALPEPKVQELAEREGAQAFVVGDIARLGAGYQITARVVATAGGAEALTVRATAASDAQLIAAVEDVGHQLRRGIGESLRSVWGAPPLARVTTSSLPALRAYTAALRAEGEGNRKQALALDKEALALDTSFAAVWTAMYVTYTNIGAVRQATEAAQQAYARRDRLSEVERLRAEAHYHQTRGETVEEEAAWARLAERNIGLISYSEMLLATGRLAEAEAMARRAVAIEPKATIGYWNLAEAQVALHEFAAADSTAALIATRLPESNYRYYIALSVPLGRRDFDAAEAELRSDTAATRARSRAGPQCMLHLMRGRLRAWERCPEGDRPVALNAHLVLSEFRMTGDTVRARRGYEPFLAAARDKRDPDAYPEVITLLADVGRVREARTLLDEWRTGAGPSDLGYRADSAEAVGALAAAEGRPDRAVAAFLAWGGTPAASSYHLHNRGLAEAGALMRRLNQPDSSIALFERALATSSTTGGLMYELGWYAQALSSLGELHEARGNRDKAAEYYRKYVDLLKDADPPIAAQVAAVRTKLARVTGEPAARR